MATFSPFYNPAAASLQRLLNSGEYSDLIIECCGCEWKVHKAIVCFASDFFKNACKYGRGRDEGRIELEDDVGMIKRLIVFCYWGDYEPTQDHSAAKLERCIYNPIAEELQDQERKNHKALPYGTSPIFGSKPYSETDQACHCVSSRAKANDQSPKSVISGYELYQTSEALTIHATMYALADKYFMKDLAHFAKEKFERCLYFHWDSKDFVNAVQVVYTSTPESNRGLRDVVLKAFREYLKLDLRGREDLEAQLQDFNWLTLEMAKLKI